MRPQQNESSREGFSLLELIGVLAVMAVLAAVVLPFLTLSIDQAVNDKETADLDALEAALQQSILRHGSITNWANLSDQIAAELGVGPSGVSTNARRQPRFFLVDPAMQMGSNGRGLPYVQTASGSVVTNAGGIIAPVNPRLMILTSLGQPLSGITTGPPAVPGDFDIIWNTAEGVVPAANALLGWKGKASDLKIKRINLSGLFVHLILARNNSTGICKYSLNAEDYATASPVPNQTVEGYFFKSSVLLLYKGDGTLDSKQVLRKDDSYVYDQEVWRGSLDTNSTVGQLDLRSIANQFLGAYPNARAAPTSAPSNVLQAMINYFNAYDAWAASNFTSAALKNSAIALQADLMTKVQGLYSTPSYAPIQVACP